MSESFDYESVDGFEWDENKRNSNLVKHGIDFEDAIEIFNGRLLVRRSDRHDEERWVAIGSLEGRLIAVTFTRRAKVVRIISARRARKNEERAYRNKGLGRSPQG